MGVGGLLGFLASWTVSDLLQLAGVAAQDAEARGLISGSVAGGVVGGLAVPVAVVVFDIKQKLLERHD